MDEILFDLRDDRIDLFIKTAMEERYKHLFTLFKRVAPPYECMKYILTKQKDKRRGSKNKKKLIK